MSGWSVKDSVSKVVVLAWENNLKELLEAESLVAVAVKEKDKSVKLRLRDMVDTVVSKEVCELS